MNNFEQMEINLFFQIWSYISSQVIVLVCVYVSPLVLRRFPNSFCGCCWDYTASNLEQYTSPSLLYIGISLFAAIPRSITTTNICGCLGYTEKRTQLSSLSSSWRFWFLHRPPLPPPYLTGCAYISLCLLLVAAAR